MYFLRRFVQLTMIYIVFPVSVFCWAALTTGINQEFYRQKILGADYITCLALIVVAAFFITSLFCLTIYIMPYRREILENREHPVHRAPYIRQAYIPIFSLLLGVIAETLIGYQGLPLNYTAKDVLGVFGHVLSPMIIYYFVLYFGKRSFFKEVFSKKMRSVF